ncbi:MAG: hypothetical protein IJT73_04135 [Selenomonadaceae bacterium]|nr:hypothetical protein [Selenomonadaceae bacterium]
MQENISAYRISTAAKKMPRTRSRIAYNARLTPFTILYIKNFSQAA